MRRSAASNESGPGGPTRTLAEDLLASQLLETVPDAMVAVDAAGTIRQVNAQTESLFGYKREELIGQKVELLIPERYRQPHQGHRAEFAEKPKTRRMGSGLSLYGRRRDGSEFPVEISLSPVSMNGGHLVLSAIRDVSERKKIEEDLRLAHAELDRRTTQQLGEYRAKLAAIVDSSEDAIIGKDLEGNITSWNKGAQRIYGYSPEEVMGKNIALLLPPDRPEEISHIMEKIRHGGSVEHFESVRVAKDGRHLNVSVTVSPLRDARGEIVGASAIGRDITAQKRAEEHLRQAQKMEAVGRLAGGVAHDFNNILGIVTACTELLRDRIEPGGEPAQYIANIQKAVERGAALTRQLLAFSRKQVVQPRVLDLRERLQEITKLLRPLMGDDVEIVVHTKAGAALVEVDPGHLDQVVVNLAVNSRDAMPHGGKFIVETGVMNVDRNFAEMHRPMKAGKYVLLAVSDTGSGMDESTLAQIFEPFFTTKEVGKGTGLGLATVYGIVKQNAGHVWVYSEPGRGTTFKIYLPSAEDKVGLAAGPEREAVAPRREGATILLVEDDELMCRLTQQLLEQHGYTILVAKDGQEALERAQSHSGPIELLLTDVVMRGMSGPELVARMGQSHPEVKVVYMSGYTGELIAEHDLLKPGITLLEKPFTRTALLNTLHQALA